MPKIGFMNARALLLAALAWTACSPEMPPTSTPTPATLGTFEGEMDPVAGTFTIRSTNIPSAAATPGTSLVIAEGASTVTISSASVSRVTNGCSAGVDALQALRARGVDTPAVLLTAISDGSLRGVDGLDAAALVLPKPVTRRGLARALERVARPR